MPRPPPLTSGAAGYVGIRRVSFCTAVAATSPQHNIACSSDARVLTGQPTRPRPSTGTMAENPDLGLDGILASLARLETSPSPRASPSPSPIPRGGHRYLESATPAVMPRPPALVFHGHQRGAHIAASPTAASPPLRDSSCSSTSEGGSGPDTGRVHTRVHSERRVGARRSLVYVPGTSLVDFSAAPITGLHQLGAVAA